MKARTQRSEKLDLGENRFDLDPETELANAIGDVREIMQSAKQSGDVRLQILAGQQLKPLLDSLHKARERSKGADNDVRQQAMAILAALPDDFVKALRDGNDDAMSLIEKALPGPQKGVEDTEPANTAATTAEAS